MVEKTIQTQSSFQRFLSRMLVRFNFIKKVSVDIDDINQIITPQLPVSLELLIPGGTGDLRILAVDLSLLKNENSISAELLCNFSVKVKTSIIYNTHLKMVLEAKPVYHNKNKSIALKDVKIRSLELISDEYSVIKDTRTLISGFLPEPLRTIFASTLIITAGILESIGISEMVKYLSLYLTGSKQRILEFHHVDIENKIINYTKSESFCYRLDESDFKEQLFADFGEKVMIENGQLFFIFNA